MPLDIAALRARRPQTEFHYFPSIDSTMREAARLVTAGAPYGAVVIADEQSAGMGRLGRAWHSEAEAGIYCSVLLRFAVPSNQTPVVTLLLGLATAAAIEKTTDLACDLRWPNDVLINGKKTAGILAQLVDACIIAGIGINVNQSELPDGLRTPATSLRIASGGRNQSREAILLALLDSIDSFGEMLLHAGPEAVIRAFSAASSYAVDRRVILEETGQHGTTAGVDSNGFLLVRFDSGKVERIAAGGVRPE
ncbi:MAG TPA: biotin--[acetyl-CoA-carboxylase] ligase [Bryobacteraceae bacterium]|jgi:BirA family biotin operon repressor/biotin-[acetyl-CoA-carboxylase] ligase|nr:biotin--[acetyl-CoA-carboxylase] ligase [Bryobacteraceae bacterium]